MSETREREKKKICYCYSFYNYCAQCRLFTYNTTQRSSTNNAPQKYRNERDDKNKTTILFLFFVRFLIVFGAFHSFHRHHRPCFVIYPHEQLNITSYTINSFGQIERQIKITISFFRLSPNQSKLTFFLHAYQVNSLYLYYEQIYPFFILFEKNKNVNFFLFNHLKKAHIFFLIIIQHEFFSLLLILLFFPRRYIFIIIHFYILIIVNGRVILL